MDYNTQREKLIMPEYGRYVQEMVGEVKKIKDKKKRSEQVRAIVNVMATLNPQMREGANYKHKLWDHIHVIAGYDLDIDDAPYPPPLKEVMVTKPHEIRIETSPVKVMHYGRNIQNMVMAIAAKPDDAERAATVLALAHYMRKQYLIWNKGTVTDQIIFNDIEKLSNGQLKVPEGMKLSEIRGEYRQPNQMTSKQQAHGYSWSANKKKH